MGSSQKRHVEWGKNFLILLLTLSAIYLIGQSGLYGELNGILGRGHPQGGIGFQPEGGQTMQQLSVQPVRLAVQNVNGRYGVQYEQETVDQLFESRLGSLLREALGEAEYSKLAPVTQEQWQIVLHENRNWVYYDFMSGLPINEIATWLGRADSRSDIEKYAQRFLLAEQGGSVVLYFCDETGVYYACSLFDLDVERLVEITTGFEPNGAIFAFESPEQYRNLKSNVMILPTIPEMPLYDVSNPLTDMTESQLKDLLRILNFNPRLVPLEFGEGFTVRDGADSLRIDREGGIVYHGKDTAPSRYPVDGKEPGRLIEATQEILSQVMETYAGEGRYFFRAMTEGEDGATALTYGYSLNGAPVEVYGQDCGAKFTIRDGAISDYIIYVRQYSSTGELALILPEEKALAAMEALGLHEKELLLAYADPGDALRITANWMAN